MVSVCLGLFLYVFVVQGALAALPGGLKACKMSSKDFTKCLSEQVTNSLKVFKDGSKKFGMNPIDPFKFQKLIIDQGTGPVAVKLEFRNLNVFGVSSAKVVDSKCDWKTMMFKGHIDNLAITGDYTVSGKVLVLPISGTGKSNISMSDVVISLNMKLKEISKGGKSYFQAETFDISITPKKTFFYFENLFNGDKALGDNMNMFLNENHEQILNELKPAISRALSQGFIQVTNLVFSNIPVNEIKIK